MTCTSLNALVSRMHGSFYDGMSRWDVSISLNPTLLVQYAKPLSSCHGASCRDTAHGCSTFQLFNLGRPTPIDSHR